MTFVAELKIAVDVKKHILYLLIVVSLFHVTYACKGDKPKIVKGFYYWKSNQYSLAEKELTCLDEEQIQKLYVKFFDVEKNEVLGAVPVAKTELNIWEFRHNSDTLSEGGSHDPMIVPTIYIKNEVFAQSSSGSLDTLASNTIFLIDKYFQNHMKTDSIDYSEIQIDCDWTEKTRDNYFSFLQKIKATSKKNVSCTLRLYPYKYRDQLGIPPVDRAVLMCYNLISPLASEDKNSILSPEELEKYLIKTPRYPLPLDVALPVFSWMQVYQNNRFVGLINPRPHELDSFLKPVKPLWFQVTRDKELETIFLRSGDKIKYEEITPETIRKTIHLLKKYIPSAKDQTIILFHLDGDHLDQFNHETLNSFFTDFIQ